MEKIVFNNYKVNDKGEVFSLKRNKKMTTSLNHKGYEQIYIIVDGKKKTTFVHRLVAIAFLPNINNLPQVNHKDGNKLNNNVENLEWVDNTTNSIHAFEHNLKVRKPCRMLNITNGEIKEFESIKSCADYLNTTQYNVSRVCSGIRKSLFGKYYFELIN